MSFSSRQRNDSTSGVDDYRILSSITSDKDAMATDKEGNGLPLGS